MLILVLHDVSQFIEVSDPLEGAQLDLFEHSLVDCLPVFENVHEIGSMVLDPALVIGHQLDSHVVDLLLQVGAVAKELISEDPLKPSSDQVLSCCVYIPDSSSCYVFLADSLHFRNGQVVRFGLKRPDLEFLLPLLLLEQADLLLNALHLLQPMDD